jgi:hypothetical protein
MWNLKIVKLIGTERKIVITRGWEGWGRYKIREILVKECRLLARLEE